MLAVLNKLCTPAYVYLVISAISILVLAFQNLGSNQIFCAGSFSCSANNTALVFVIQVIYVLFWTWLLNKLCQNGASTVSWILVLLPLIMMFLFIVLFLLFSAPLPTTTYRLV